LGELYAGAHHVDDPTPLLEKIADLLADVRVLDFDLACAKRFGEVRGTMLRQGISIPTADLMIGAIALVHNLTLATNNTTEFSGHSWLAAR
jgi:tRNA(fMet)-specific endonuclease VapC